MPTPPLNRTTLPLTYPDAVCYDDLDALGRETTSDLETLVQDIFHLLDEDLGSNPDDPNRGLGLYQLLSSATQSTLPNLERRAETMLLTDDRISTAQVRLVAGADASSYTLAVTIGVGTKVLGLAFSFDAVKGLQFDGFQVAS